MSLSLTTLFASNNTTKAKKADNKETYYPYAEAGFIVPIGLIMAYDFFDRAHDLGKIDDPTNSQKEDKTKYYILGGTSALVSLFAWNIALTEKEFPISYAYDGKTNYVFCKFKF
jgi:hypothetical protein